MRRSIKRKTFSKERIIMAASSVLVLGALTATGLWMRGEEESQDDGYVVDFSSIENTTEAENDALQDISVAGAAVENAISSDDLDYDPYFQETNSGNVENPDLSGSSSMSDGAMNAAPGMLTEDAISQALTEEETLEVPEVVAEVVAAESAAQKEEDENTQAISTAMQPTLNFEDGDSLIWPVVGNVLINYSMDKTIYFPTLDQYKYNPAIVIQANEGDMITAAAAGKVTSVFKDAQIGTAVTMDLGNGYEITYGQLENVLVSEGSYVSMGDMIAQVAAPTAYYSVEGTNVYFKLTKDGEPLNPMTCLK